MTGPNLLPRPRHVDVGDHLVTDPEVTEAVDPALPAQGYELDIGDRGVTLVAADDAGAFYGRCTLAQLRRLHAGALPAGRIRDHPDLAVRGVMLDVSRARVPTLAGLRSLVDLLASWKVNQLQLYLEHTFAYRDHPEVHAGASPFTAAEIRELDEHCARRHVELVPNQNCLGHMERWLRHERYRSLALRPEGFVDQYRMRRPATTIDPADPGSLVLVQGLLRELLPNFRSRRVHVGLDEAWELPPERTGDVLDWVARLRALPEVAGREVLMWADMVIDDPVALARVPDGVTVCEWGYEALHPFADRATRLAAAGVPFWVAPGTSSWLSILGRVSNARANCRAAARAALDHGAAGYLVTDWGDRGHLQQPVISLPGLATAAAVSWCTAANADLDLGAALSAHAFEDPTGELAGALLTLGDAHRVVTPQRPNGATIVHHLYFPQLTVGRGATRGITAAEVDALAGLVEDSRARLRRAAPADGAPVEELDWSARLVVLLTDDLRARLAADGTLEAVPAPVRRDLAARLALLIEEHGALWHARNRPGGLAESRSWLENLHGCYVSGRTDPGWGGLVLRSAGRG